MLKNSFFALSIMKKLLLLIIVILALKISSCARIGSPTGGSKDTIAPVMAIAKPLNKTVSFKEKKIVILFDEYIKFNQLNSQLIISPPIEKKPIIKPQSGVSKKITIEFLEDLAPNTTYSINFGNSIIDNNEGNQLGRFSYVFSTGLKLDSLTISGDILDPLSKKDIENISIMAYKDGNDTLVGNSPPNYLTNTLNSSKYNLENLSEANYKLLALEDKNNNYKYDKGFERIGFLNEDIKLNSNKDSIIFTLFKEAKENKIFNPKQTSGNNLIIGFQGLEKPIIDIEGTPIENYLISREVDKDSLYVWFKERPIDSLKLTLSQDTIIKKFTYKIRELKKDSLILKSNLLDILHPNDSISLTTNIPINNINKDSISLLENDSINIPCQITSLPNIQTLKINFIRKLNTKYSLVLKENAFSDFLKNKSNYKKFNFNTLDREDYGEIILEIDNPNNYNLIIELLNTTSSKKLTQITRRSGKVYFKNLTPGEYTIKTTKDLNNNNLFDNGSYYNKEQPEPIFNFSKTITLRANSEINEKISLN